MEYNEIKKCIYIYIYIYIYKWIKNIVLSDTEIEKKPHKFQCHKNSTLIDDADIDKIIVRNKVSLSKKGFKWSIGYKDNEKVKLLCIMLPKMNGHGKNINAIKCFFR